MSDKPGEALLVKLLQCINDETDDGTRAFELVGELVETADRSISPDLVNALRTFVMQKHPYGRDTIATAYAEIEGLNALPILLRASSVDMGEEDDQEQLRSIIADTMSLDPDYSAKVIEELAGDKNPRIREVSVQAKEMLAFLTDS